MKLTIVGVKKEVRDDEEIVHVDLLLDGKAGYVEYGGENLVSQVALGEATGGLFDREPAFDWEIRDRLRHAPNGGLTVPQEVELGDRWMWLRRPPRPTPNELLLTGVDLQDEFEFEGGRGVRYRAYVRVDGTEYSLTSDHCHNTDPPHDWGSFDGEIFGILPTNLGNKVLNAIAAFHEGQPKPLPFDLKAWDIYNDPWWKAGVERSRRALEAAPPRRPSR